MAGRGRGVKTGSLTQEQLQALGCVGKDMPSVTLAPPPLFPPLLAKPVPLENNKDREYKILWKEDFITYLKDSPYCLNRKNTKNENPRYSETIANALENESKRKQKSDFSWDRMPKELYPNFKRKRDKVVIAADKKPKSEVNVQEKLKMLEEKEKFDRGDDEVVKEVKRKTGNEDDDDEEKEDEEELEEDEEMDDDNDYGNNYFDNGESFNDEDDNLDDGPVY